MFSSIARNNLLLDRGSLVRYVVPIVGNAFRRAYGGDEKTITRIIGKREIVGYGVNGQPFYVDLPGFPFPAIRYMEPNPSICALRELESGDWRKLCIEDKKALYRASFCQTFAEFSAYSSDWKAIVGITSLLVGATVLWYFIVHDWIAHRTIPLPESFSPKSVQEQMKRQINLGMNPIHGIASYWDYDKCEWKNKGSAWEPDNPFEPRCDHDNKK